MFSHVPSHSFSTMIIVLLTLVIASAIRMILEKKRPEDDYTELRQRIQSWWWMIAITFTALSYSLQSAIIFFAFLSFLVLKEFLSIVPLRQVDRRVIFWLYLSIPFQYYWVASQWYGMFMAFIPVYVFLLSPIRMVLSGETNGFIKSAGLLNWAVMLAVFSISHIAYLMVLPVKNHSAGDIGLVLFLVVMTQANDVCQYLWGKRFGNRKIVPKISPNKTWEGFIGGIISTTILSGLFAPFLTPLSNIEGCFAGLMIGVGGFFGDIVISTVKRDLHIKDSGNLIPGHGGILDRMDSLIYSAPLFFHYLRYFHY